MTAQVEISGKPPTSWESEPWATLVLQTGVNREKEEVFVGSVILHKEAKRKRDSWIQKCENQDNLSNIRKVNLRPNNLSNTVCTEQQLSF